MPLLLWGFELSLALIPCTVRGHWRCTAAQPYWRIEALRQGTDKRVCVGGSCGLHKLRFTGPFPPVQDVLSDAANPRPPHPPRGSPGMEAARNDCVPNSSCFFISFCKQGCVCRAGSVLSDESVCGCKQEHMQNTGVKKGVGSSDHGKVKPASRNTPTVLTRPLTWWQRGLAPEPRGRCRSATP